MEFEFVPITGSYAAMDVTVHIPSDDSLGTELLRLPICSLDYYRYLKTSGLAKMSVHLFLVYLYNRLY